MAPNAVATAAALNVTEPTSTGIGGDVFGLYYEAASGRVTALNGSGRSPLGLTLERLQREGVSVSSIHLRYLNPFPKNLASVLKNFDKVLVPHERMIVDGDIAWSHARFVCR